MFEDILGKVSWIPDSETPCSVDPDSWADSSVFSKEPGTKELAKRLCRTKCPYLYDCFNAAMEEERGLGGETIRHYGIRGGLTPRERYNLARKAS